MGGEEVRGDDRHHLEEHTSSHRCCGWHRVPDWSRGRGGAQGRQEPPTERTPCRGPGVELVFTPLKVLHVKSTCSSAETPEVSIAWALENSCTAIPGQSQAPASPVFGQAWSNRSRASLAPRCANSLAQT